MPGAKKAHIPQPHTSKYPLRCYWFRSRAEYTERNPPVAAEGIGEPLGFWESRWFEICEGKRAEAEKEEGDERSTFPLINKNG